MFGGLRVHRAEEVAPSAFLASIHATSLLTQSILSTNFSLLSSRAAQEALSLWSLGHAFSPPSGEVACHQRVWDHLRAEAAADHLLECSCDDEDRARLLASTRKESGAWLNALPISSAGLCLDDDSLRITVGLAWALPSVALMFAITVMNKLEFLAGMVSAADGVKADTIDMLLLMKSSQGPSLQSMSLLF